MSEYGGLPVSSSMIVQPSDLTDQLLRYLKTWSTYHISEAGDAPFNEITSGATIPMSA
jgi:hypothetical protein